MGVCSTVYGDDACKGCKRYYDEVIAWNTWTLPQKRAVYARMADQMQSVMARYLYGFSFSKLQDLLRLHGINAEYFDCHYLQLYFLWVNNGKKKPDTKSGFFFSLKQLTLKAA